MRKDSRSEPLQTGFDLADHVKRPVAEDDAVLSRVLHGQTDAVCDCVAGRDGFAELGQVLRQIVRVQRAGIARRDGDEFLRVGLDVPVHTVIILIGKNAGQDGQRPAGQIVLNVLDERLNALRVVSAVDDEQRVLAPYVEPARPADVRKPFANLFVRDVPAALLHDGRRGEGDGSVVQLMVAQQRQLQRVEALPVEGLTGQIVGNEPDVGKVRLVELCTDRGK